MFPTKLQLEGNLAGVVASKLLQMPGVRSRGHERRQESAYSVRKRGFLAFNHPPPAVCRSKHDSHPVLMMDRETKRWQLVGSERL